VKEEGAAGAPALETRGVVCFDDFFSFIDAKQMSKEAPSGHRDDSKGPHSDSWRFSFSVCVRG
jgi:hypothetical protein